MTIVVLKNLHPLAACGVRVGWLELAFLLSLLSLGRAEAQRRGPPPGWTEASTDPRRDGVVLPIRSAVGSDVTHLQLFATFVGGLAVTVVFTNENPTGEGRSRGNLIPSSVLCGTFVGALGLWVTSRDSVFLD